MCQHKMNVFNLPNVIIGHQNANIHERPQRVAIKTDEADSGRPFISSYLNAGYYINSLI